MCFQGIQAAVQSALASIGTATASFEETFDVKAGSVRCAEPGTGWAGCTHFLFQLDQIQMMQHGGGIDNLVVDAKTYTLISNPRCVPDTQSTTVAPAELKTCPWGKNTTCQARNQNGCVEPCVSILPLVPPCLR